MYPVLFNIGNFQVSTFGILLALGIFAGSFTVWRIARGYEIDSEKTLDLILLTVGISFLTSRLFFVLANLSAFTSVSQVFLINTYPGLDFWGGFLGGLLTLLWLARRNKINFLQLGDFAIVGFFIASFFGFLGCLLGGCGAGIETNQFFGVNQAGLIGKRIPIQIIEAMVFFLYFWGFWKSAIKFHIEGSILAKGLMVLGLIEAIASFFKSQPFLITVFNFRLNMDLIISVCIFIVGVKVYYFVYRKTPVSDLGNVWRMLTDGKTRSKAVVNLKRRCYNHWVNFRVWLGKGKKRLFKFLNIKPNPNNF